MMTKKGKSQLADLAAPDADLLTTADVCTTRQRPPKIAFLLTRLCYTLHYRQHVQSMAEPGRMP